MICDKCKKEKKIVHNFKNTPLKFCTNCFSEIFNKKIKKAIRGKIDIKKPFLIVYLNDLASEILLNKISNLFYYKEIYVLNYKKNKSSNNNNLANINYLDEKITNLKKISKKEEYNILLPIELEKINSILLYYFLLKKNINFNNIILAFSDITQEDLRLYNSLFIKSKLEINNYLDNDIIKLFSIKEHDFYSSLINELNKLYKIHNGIIYSIFKSFNSFKEKELI